MVAKTTFTEKEFVALLSNYDLGEFREARPLAEGTVQTNWLLHTSQGRYVFKYYESRPLKSVRFEANALNYIQRHNFPSAYPQCNRQGSMVGVYRQKPIIIFNHIDGQHVEQLNDVQRKQVIQAAARLQSITNTYRPALRRYRWNYSRELCWQLAQAETAKIGTPNARQKLDWFGKRLAAMKLPRALPKGICHCDYDLSNLLFRGNELVALVDFDDANYTYLTFDLVNMIDGWAWPYQGAFNLDFARKIVQTYEQARTLSSLEKRYLFDVHQLQIMFDGIWFFARGEAADFYEKQKIDYLNSLGREGYFRAICC